MSPSAALNVKVSGMARAIPVGALMPGKAPTTIPTSVPARMSRRTRKVNTPSRESIMTSIAFLQASGMENRRGSPRNGVCINLVPCPAVGFSTTLLQGGSVRSQLKDAEFFLVDRFRYDRFKFRFQNVVDLKSQRDSGQWAGETRIPDRQRLRADFDSFRVGCSQHDHQFVLPCSSARRIIRAWFSESMAPAAVQTKHSVTW